MMRVSRWCNFVFFMGLLGCGSGFEAKIRPASEFAARGGSGVCCSGPVSSPRSELLDNTGFESGLTGWEDWGSSSLLTGGAHSGAKAVRVTSQGGRGQEVIYRLKTGATYLLKGYGRVASTSDVVYMGIKFFDSGNATMDDQRVRVNTTNYSEYDVRFKVPIQVSSAKIYVYKDSTTSTPADFDDFSLTMVEAPANPPMLPAVSNPGNLQPMGPAPGWTMVLNEDFTSTALNTSVWNSGFWFSYTINNELQAYRPENVKPGGGTLSLLAEKRSTTTTWGDPMNYASGAVTTRNKFTFTFGVAEARIKVPRGRGYHPAFWMLPNNKRSPPQFDVMRIYGHDTTYSHFTYMWMDDNGIPHGQPMGASRGDYAAGYHTFTLEWLPDTINYYIDGTLAGTYKGDFVLRDPAYLILNLAVGGDEPGNPDASTVFPQSMDVDYVRVWQKPL